MNEPTFKIIFSEQAGSFYIITVERACGKRIAFTFSLLHTETDVPIAARIPNGPLVDPFKYQGSMKHAISHYRELRN